MEAVLLENTNQYFDIQKNIFLFDLFSKHCFEDVAKQNPALPTNKSIIKKHQVHLSAFFVLSQ